MPALEISCGLQRLAAAVICACRMRRHTDIRSAQKPAAIPKNAGRLSSEPKGW